MATKGVSETAFLSNWARASLPQLSRDEWANIWVTPKVTKLGEKFREEVSPYDETLLSLRCRYFVEAIEAFAAKQKTFTFINVGAGFTSYPFLDVFKNANTQIYEFDSPAITTFKQINISILQKEGTLPNRRVEYVGVDLNDRNSHRLIREKISQDGKSFILLEGIVCVLKEAAFRQLLTTIEGALPPGSQLGIEVWPPSIQDSPVIQAAQDFFEKEYGMPPQAYTWTSESFFDDFPSLKILEKRDYFDLHRAYAKEEPPFTRDTIFDEKMYLLEKS